MFSQIHSRQCILFYIHTIALSVHAGILDHTRLGYICRNVLVSFPHNDRRVVAEIFKTALVVEYLIGRSCSSDSRPKNSSQDSVLLW